MAPIDFSVDVHAQYCNVLKDLAQRTNFEEFVPDFVRELKKHRKGNTSAVEEVLKMLTGIAFADPYFLRCNLDAIARRSIGVNAGLPFLLLFYTCKYSECDRFCGLATL